jgi:hypothetical protein
VKGDDSAVTKDRQIRIWVRKQKQLAKEAPDRQTRDYILMMWLGYLNGLRLTNVITYTEYRSLYRELKEYAAGTGAA